MNPFIALPKDLPKDDFVSLQKKFVTSFFTRNFYKFVKLKRSNNEDELANFWTSWPSDRFNGAAVFGFFFRMEEEKEKEKQDDNETS